MIRRNSSTSLVIRGSYLGRVLPTCLPFSWVDGPLFLIGGGVGAKIIPLLVTLVVPVMLINGSSNLIGSSYTLWSWM